MAGTFLRIISGVPRTIQIDQEVTLASGISTKTVTFPSTLQTSNASPRVVAWMYNGTDSNPQFIPVTITARSSTGFTATWDNATDTANYILGYTCPDGWVA